MASSERRTGSGKVDDPDLRAAETEDGADLRAGGDG